MCEHWIAHWVAAMANSGCFILMCLYTLPLWALRKEQWGHANGFSPVWVRRCRPKSTGLRKKRPHWGHFWPVSLPTPLPCSVPVGWRVWLGAGVSRVSRWERVALDDAPACRKNKSGFSIDFGSLLVSTNSMCSINAASTMAKLCSHPYRPACYGHDDWLKGDTHISVPISKDVLYTPHEQCSKE